MKVCQSNKLLMPILAEDRVEEIQEDSKNSLRNRGAINNSIRNKLAAMVVAFRRLRVIQKVQMRKMKKKAIWEVKKMLQIKIQRNLDFRKVKVSLMMMNSEYTKFTNKKKREKIKK